MGELKSKVYKFWRPSKYMKTKNATYNKSEDLPKQKESTTYEKRTKNIIIRPIIKIKEKEQSKQLISC